MALRPAQLISLRDEIAADPEGLGLAWANGDQATADALNEVRAGSTVQNREIPATAVVGAIAYAEYVSRDPVARQYLDLVVSAEGGRGGSLDVSPGSSLRAALLVIFDNATAPLTRAALVAAVQRPGSRAEELFGAGVVVTAGDVGRAEALLP